jgi:endonuclease/exonuclease/phosphatase (EEP) superfamily protein YafD
VLRAVLAVLAVWIVVRVLGLEAGWPLVAVLAFTPYAGLVAIGLLAVAIAARRRPESLVALVVVAGFAAVLIPRAVPAQPTGPIADGTSLDVLTTNVYLGEADAETVVELVRDGGVDLLSVQELTDSEVERLRAAGIDELLPEQHLASTPEGSSGAGLYSRFPLRPRAEVPGGISRMVRAVVRVPGTAPVDVVAVHAYPPNHLTTAQWQEGLEALPRAEAGGATRLLAGDFNATFDHDEFRDLVGSGYVDAGAAMGRGLEATWSSTGIEALPVTIDHVLAEDEVHVAGIELSSVPGTDHRAVLARLVLPPRR